MRLFFFATFLYTLLTLFGPGRDAAVPNLTSFVSMSDETTVTCTTGTCDSGSGEDPDLKPSGWTDMKRFWERPPRPLFSFKHIPIVCKI
jgi:hypothetical protein